MDSRTRLKPIRIVLRWQIAVTAVLTLAAALLWGRDGALSAALGGGVNVAAGWAYGWRISRADPRTAGETLATLFGAWGIKVLLIVASLLLVLKMYPGLVPAAFFAAFVVTVAVFTLAIAVRDTPENPTLN